jgi:hypothetical protein
MTDTQHPQVARDQLREAAQRASNGNLDTAERVTVGEIECPLCGDGTIDHKTWTNIDDKPIGIEVFGLGDALTAYEAFVRLANPVAILSLLDELASSQERETILREREAALVAALNTPEIDDFAKGVVSEAQHQRQRWGSDHDAGKEPLDWFWLIGYLGQKAVTAAQAGDMAKAKHHTISTAAALANWHAQLLGANSDMRPGVDAATRGFENLSPKGEA